MASLGAGQDGIVRIRRTVQAAGSVATAVLVSMLLAACGGSSSSTTSTTTTTVLHSQPATAIWPYYGSAARYHSGVAAARGFAVGMLGMVDPTVGMYHSQSSTTGYVDVAPSVVATPTTVRVALIANSWWATAASTSNIVVTVPVAMQLVTSPIALRGSALAYEGVINVSLYVDGGPMPIAVTTVLGGGDQLRPFSGSLSFTSTKASYGTLMFYAKSAKDGSTSSATAFRVRY